jgi:hypothetical protein
MDIRSAESEIPSGVENLGIIKEFRDDDPKVESGTVTVDSPL